MESMTHLIGKHSYALNKSQIHVACNLPISMSVAYCSNEFSFSSSFKDAFGIFSRSFVCPSHGLAVHSSVDPSIGHTRLGIVFQ